MHSAPIISVSIAALALNQKRLTDGATVLTFRQLVSNIRSNEFKLLQQQSGAQRAFSAIS
jgi:hypothetical protein